MELKLTEEMERTCKAVLRDIKRAEAGTDWDRLERMARALRYASECALIEILRRRFEVIRTGLPTTS